MVAGVEEEAGLPVCLGVAVFPKVMLGRGGIVPFEDDDVGLGGLVDVTVFLMAPESTLPVCARGLL